MLLTPNDMKSFRGSWVEITGKERLGYSGDEVTQTRLGRMSGILGRDIKPSRHEGFLSFKLSNLYTCAQVEKIVEVWKPAKTAIRYLCNSCLRSTEVGIAYMRLHPGCYTSIRSKKCSLCGGTPVTATPSDCWQFGTPDELLESLQRYLFSRKLTTHNATWQLDKVSRPRFRFSWQYEFTSSAGYLICQDDGPPTVLDWEGWFDLPGLKSRFSQGRSHNGEISWKNEEKE